VIPVDGEPVDTPGVAPCRGSIGFDKVRELCDFEGSAILQSVDRLIDLMLFLAYATCSTLSALPRPTAHLCDPLLGGHGCAQCDKQACVAVV
jgi:hypothetical protein